jgi:hypothetical protein
MAVLNRKKGKITLVSDSYKEQKPNSMFLTGRCSVFRLMVISYSPSGTNIFEPGPENGEQKISIWTLGSI